jgi:hypothetical protein
MLHIDRRKREEDKSRYVQETPAHCNHAVPGACGRLKAYTQIDLQIANKRVKRRGKDGWGYSDSSLQGPSL